SLDAPIFYSILATALASPTLSLHDALPISISPFSARQSASPSVRNPATDEPLQVQSGTKFLFAAACRIDRPIPTIATIPQTICRSEEHTSELQSLAYLVCRLLLEKKKICYF